MKNSKGQIVVMRRPWDYDPGTVYILYLATPKEVETLFYENFEYNGFQHSRKNTIHDSNTHRSPFKVR